MAYSSITKPELHFNTITYTGDGTSPKARTGVGFKPDWVWSKTLSEIRSHQLIDSARGVNKTLTIDNSNAEITDSNHGYLQTFDSDGFTSIAGSSGHNNWNKNSETYVAWNWKANGGTGASNSDGSISSTVYANTTAGFSMVKYTGTGSVATVGHGLGAAPNLIIFKNRTDSGHSYDTYHHKIGTAYRFYFNDYVAKQSATNFINDTAPTSSVFTVGVAGHTNGSGDDQIAYCFVEKRGYSKFGEYKGNGNNNGSFVFTGFKPALIIFKRSNSTGNYTIVDNRRGGINPANQAGNVIYANENYAASTSATQSVDLLSNGFKIRGSGTNINTSAGQYVYIAFAENPLVANVGTNGIPATAG